MGIGDQLQKLDDLRRRGALSEEEFLIAKQKLLAEPAEGVEDDRFAELKAQNDVLQLDRAWELERENYMMTGRYGHRYIPGKSSSVLGGIFLAGFGVLWTIVTFSMASGGAPGLIGLVFPMFGVVFVLFGVVMSLTSFSKATQYEQAFENYQRRRQELLNRA